jgi:basic membrane protein A
MFEMQNPSRRKFLTMAGAAAGGSLVGGSGLVLPPAYAAGALGPVKEQDAVIAFGHVGPISDEGWTSQHHEGMLAVKAAYPKAKYLEIETIPYSADATRTFRQFVAEKATIVISSSEYGDLLAEVSNRAPSVAFMECNGHRVADNVSWYYLKHWMPTYVVGVAAGLMSKTGKLGYVASFPVPSVFGSVNAFQMGAKSVNPKATTQVISINSWFDPQGASQAGTALLDNGADFLFGIMDEAAYLQVAEKRGIPAAMWNTDVRRYGPKSYVSSVVCDWRKFYVEQVGKRLAGAWNGKEQILLPLAGGIDRDAWGESVPANVRTAADAVRTKMLKDGFDPFVGEIKDAAGKVKVAKGAKMDDVEIYNWNWAVEGVTGLGA